MGSVAELSHRTAKFEHLEGLVGHPDAIQLRCAVDLELAAIDVEDQGNHHE